MKHLVVTWKKIMSNLLAINWFGLQAGKVAGENNQKNQFQANKRKTC